MSEKITEIIHPDVFVREKSSTILARLCRPDHDPTDAEIATLVVQYLWRYHKKGASDAAGVGSITGLMAFMEYYFGHTRFFGARFDFSKLDPVMVPIFDFLKQHGYAVSMLGDVSSTTAIVRSIILEKLDFSRSKPFQGLDIGTGSGILALAQYILARRRGYNTIRIDGIEQNVHVARQAEYILRTFVPGGVFHVHGADATRDYAYKKIPNKPDFVSIEMLPFSGSDMIIQRQEKSGTNTHFDPFIPTLFALSHKFPNLVNVACFPYSLQNIVELTGKNVVGIIDLPLFGEKGLLYSLYGTNEDDFSKEIGSISAQGIKPSTTEDVIPLSDIGSHLLHLPGQDLGWIKPLFVWRHRWRRLIEHNPKYKYLLDLFNSASPEKKKEIPVMPPLVWRDTITH